MLATSGQQPWAICDSAALRFEETGSLPGRKQVAAGVGRLPTEGQV